MNLGINDIFTKEKANLSKTSNLHQNLYISYVIQKIEISRKRSESNRSINF